MLSAFENWPLAARARHLAIRLVAAAGAETPAGMSRGRARASAASVAFVFSGQGSQWEGMGRQLLAEEPVFRAAFEACDREVFAEAGWSLVAELGAERQVGLPLHEHQRGHDDEHEL